MVKAMTMEFTQTGEHSLSIVEFPPTALSFHTMMNDGVDTTFGGTTTNWEALLTEEVILHFGLAEIEIGWRLGDIIGAGNLRPIESVQGGNNFRCTTVPQ